jgi:hypothetical protein
MIITKAMLKKLGIAPKLIPLFEILLYPNISSWQLSTYGVDFDLDSFLCNILPKGLSEMYRIKREEIEEDRHKAHIPVTQACDYACASLQEKLSKLRLALINKDPLIRKHGYRMFSMDNSVFWKKYQTLSKEYFEKMQPLSGKYFYMRYEINKKYDLKQKEHMQETLEKAIKEKRNERKVY